jgi:hypothetical protein
MATTTHNDSRTAHLIELMTKGDNAFNARDWEAVDAVHHPDMIAYITGLADPIYGAEAHAAAMHQFVRIFPDMHGTRSGQAGRTLTWDAPWLRRVKWIGRGRPGGSADPLVVVRWSFVRIVASDEVAAT